MIVVSIWKKVAERIQKTRGVLAEGVQQVFSANAKLDEATLEQLEEVLIRSDVGLETSAHVIARLRTLARERGVTEAGSARGLLAEVVGEILGAGAARRTLVLEPPAPGQPLVLLMVGVNGAGKTTSIGKLAWRCRQQGMKPLVVACDTFRAAALEQLHIWADRAGAEIIRSQSGADPAAVAFDGIRAGQARGAGVVFVDTAGRLQTNANLMSELAKIRRVVEKAQPGAPHETLLVLDATVGQNALSQVKHFSDAAGVTGILLAKLDGSARGGVILAVAHQIGVPVRYVGLGEGIEDLEEFDPAEFARALVEPVG
jgi:fused signal recognition particle receptor